MAADINAHIGARLRARRRLLGLTQAALANAIGVRFQQIQKYECAANRLSAVQLWALAAQLGVGMDYFFDGLPRSAVRPWALAADGLAPLMASSP